MSRPSDPLAVTGKPDQPLTEELIRERADQGRTHGVAAVRLLCAELERLRAVVADRDRELVHQRERYLLRESVQAAECRKLERAGDALADALTDRGVVVEEPDEQALAAWRELRAGGVRDT